MKIRIGILGYGNLGKGVEKVIKYNEDMELIAIFTRRNPYELEVKSNVEVVSVDETDNWKDKIDVMILCGGSKDDLPIQTPKYAKMFNVVDSFDTHAKILEHFENVNKSALEGNKIALISCGWDPGVFSLNRLMAESILPNGNTYTFWGTGVSQGHSDALRRIDGVKNAVQYTVPIGLAIEKVRKGENPNLSTREKHMRKCYVVLEEGADAKRIEQEIKNMPNYFADYDTEVYFIQEEELAKEHSKMPHGGFVIRSGITNEENKTNQIIEYSLKLDSNPEFTASVLLAYARAVYKLAKQNQIGAKTVLDIPPAMLSQRNREELLGSIV